MMKQSITVTDKLEGTLYESSEIDFRFACGQIDVHDRLGTNVWCIIGSICTVNFLTPNAHANGYLVTFKYLFIQVDTLWYFDSVN